MARLRIYMLLMLDTENGAPLSRQIYDKIRSAILAGDMAEGEKLPSSRSLSKDLGLTRNTVLAAYDQLLAEGYLEARHGSGTTVAKGISAIVSEKKSSVPPPLKRVADAGRINFRSGIPDLEAFPHKKWGKLYQHTCGSSPASAFRYCEPGGVWELREAIAAYLFRIRGICTTPERIMITSGSTQGLWLVSRLLSRKNRMVLVEDPVHTGLVEVIARAGHTVRGIRVDEYGMDTSALPALEMDADGLFPVADLGGCGGQGPPVGVTDAKSIAFVYVTPSHQYPLGGILSIQRRQALIRFARDADCYIVEDDYDTEFRYDGAPVSALHELAPDTVIYLGSFSKIFASAIRLGFAIIPESMLRD